MKKKIDTNLKGKKVLIIGATGSVGRHLVKHCLLAGADTVRVFSRDETKQVILEEEIGPSNKMRYLIGDIREYQRVKLASEGVQFVLHCAGLKHVKSCEYNPFEAVKTNIIGTQNIIMAAQRNNVKKVVFCSTDKAVNPSNAMGASKLMAERLISAANCMFSRQKAIFSSVRFGNIMGSRGSVIPIIAQQIKNNGPVQITHKSMTRFVMTIEDVIQLVFKALKLSKGGEVFIPIMPSIRIIDLINVMINKLAPKYQFEAKKIKIKEKGILPGEKIDEELLTSEELVRSEIKKSKGLMIIHPTYNVPKRLSKQFDRYKTPLDSSEETITIKQLADYMETHNLLDEKMFV